jgi:hypothetical protein
MPPLTFFRNLFRRTYPDTTISPTELRVVPDESLRKSQNSQNSPNSSNKIEPPQYEPFSRNGIKATDTPQWLWSNKQCRSWIIAVCVTLLNNSVEQAEEKAARFRGFRPAIFENELEEWTEIFQDEADVASVYGLVLGQTHEKGAVPRGLSFDHWENCGKKD